MPANFLSCFYIFTQSLCLWNFCSSKFFHMQKILHVLLIADIVYKTNTNRRGEPFRNWFSEKIHYRDVLFETPPTLLSIMPKNHENWFFTYYLIFIQVIVYPRTDYPISLTWLDLTRGTGKDTFPKVPSGEFEPTIFVFAVWWLNRKATLHQPSNPSNPNPLNKRWKFKIHNQYWKTTFYYNFFVSMDKKSTIKHRVQNLMQLKVPNRVLNYMLSEMKNDFFPGCYVTWACSRPFHSPSKYM